MRERDSDSVDAVSPPSEGISFELSVGADTQCADIVVHCCNRCPAVVAKGPC